ncbi:MAG: GNAT family N-acetyltransferase [Clostridia bacterium]|nr:GNAT family N-acetyltransferase [Clostridia bacterium]
MTQIRQIRPQEYLEAQNIMSLCFRYERTQTPVNDDGHRHENIYGAFDESGKMTSCVVGNPFDAFYWGQAAGMCGVGGVCTLPEHRGNGSIRRLLHFTLEQAYARGDLLSSLYPFSHPFYRRYGFETGAPADIVTVRPEGLAAFADTGRVRQYVPGQDRSDIERIYERFAAGHNLACLRTKEMWDKRLERDPYLSHTYTYVWENDEGEAQGYATVLHEKLEQGKGFTVSDWAFTTPEALTGIFGFLKRLSPSGNRRLVMTLPGDVDPFQLFAEPYGISVTRQAQGMLRVVNVERCLQLYPWEEGTSFAVCVDDPVLSCNCGVFSVRRTGGETQVRREQGKADIRASIQALSLLLLGASDLPTALRCRTDIKAGGERLPEFRRRPIYLRELF